IGFPERPESREARAEELAVGKVRARMARGAPTLPDEDLEPSLGRCGIAQRRKGLPSRQRVAELVERRAPAEKRLLEGGQDHADAATKVIAPVALGNVAACAGFRAAAGETSIEEQERAELDRVLLPRNSVGRVRRERRRPRSVGQDDLDFPVAERGLGRDTLLRRADPGRERHADGGDDSTRDARHVEAGTTGPRDHGLRSSRGGAVVRLIPDIRYAIKE